jgi:hypothetical protein
MSSQLLQEAPTVTEKAPVEWSLATRIGFRFVFSYFILYIAPGAVGSLGLNQKVESYHAFFAGLWHQIVPWVGTSILGLRGDLTEIPNGSGDQLYDYILILCIFVAALVVTLIWSLLDRKRKNYEQLYQWLRLFMRLILAGTMMLYGASKLLPMQFDPIFLGALVDPLGHLSPMGLLWNFMGYSRAYSFFGGAGEMLGGILLIVPRFSTLGALVSLGVLSNVLMLNFCYDVPRKISTLHLVLIAIFLVLPDLQRIANLFILNRTAAPARIVPFLKDKQLNRGVLILQYVYGASTLIMAVSGCYAPSLQSQAKLEGPLRGIWSVQNFTLNGVSLPALVTEQQRWQGTLQLYSFKLYDGGKNLTFSPLGDPRRAASFTLETPDPDRLFMTGNVDGLAVRATLTRVNLSDPSEFLLSNRGFHWVTPAPRWR